MKIISAQQTRELDQFTIANEPISSIDLMECAAFKCSKWIAKHFSKSTSFHIICGKGNNGGDGLAIARQLSEFGYAVRVSIIELSEKGSPDFEINRDRLNEKQITVQHINLSENLDLNPQEIIVDAILGSGINNPLTGNLLRIVSSINDKKSPNQPVVAIDLPSGLFMDRLNQSNEKSILADITLTFQTPPLSFFFKVNYARIGEWYVLDIGLDKQHLEETESPYSLVLKDDVKPILQFRSRHQYKGSFGHALLLAGSQEKAGAAVLAAKAAMRSGLGLLTVGTSINCIASLNTSLPEAMTWSLGASEIESIKNLEPFNAIGIGPGIGTSKQTSAALKMTIQEAKVPIVFDADAINILADNKTWLQFIPPNCVFTPHIGEFKRLIKNTDDSEARLAAQIEFSKRFACVVVLKGAYTKISIPDGRVFFNSTGNPGMGTAGSGDVLTGIITALLSRGYHPMHASILGVYLHGMAGDLAAKKLGMESMIAGDIIGLLPKAFKKVGK